MGSIRFLSGVCAEHLQECVPIQLLSRNPHSAVLLGAALRFSVAAALAMGAPSPSPSKRTVVFFCERSRHSQADIIPLPEGGIQLPGEEGTGGSE